MFIRTVGGFCLSLGMALAGSPAQAVIVYDDSGPTRNTTDPGDGEVWNLSGSFKGYLGTPISAKHFITADHATNATLTDITFAAGPNAGSYTTVERFSDPATDLEIWEISGTFSEWVEVYRDSDEVGKTATLLGRGRDAGTAVSVDSGGGPELKGWKWGTDVRTKSWGRNVVSGTADGGEFLSFEFNAIDDANEGGLAEFDSGGGLFIFDATDGRWELGGIHYAVDGPFRESDSASGEYNATLFDQGGLYVGPDGDYELVDDIAMDVPANGYSTRISDRLAWIDSVIPEPGSALLLIGAAVGLGWRRSR